MIKHIKFSFALLIGLLTFSSLIALSDAAILSITVHAEEEVNQKIDLEKGDHILIQFSVVGTKDSYMSFSIIYPNGSEKNFGDIGSFDESFICDIEGQHNLNFVNRDTTESKLLTLNYKIDQYVFGIPKLLFQALVIVVICLMMIAAFILLSPSL